MPWGRGRLHQLGRRLRQRLEPEAEPGSAGNPRLPLVGRAAGSKWFPASAA